MLSLIYGINVLFCSMTKYFRSLCIILVEDARYWQQEKADILQALLVNSNNEMLSDKVENKASNYL